MFSRDALRSSIRNSALYLQMAVLALAGVAPILDVGSASAAQLTSRKVTISSSKAGEANVSYDFEFDYASTTPQSAILQFCDAPLGTCTLPNSMDISAATVGSLSNFNGGTDGSLASSSTNACTDPGVTMICFPIASASAGAGTNSLIPVVDVENPTPTGGVNNITVYVRLSLFTSNNYTAPAIHEGTVAASIQQQLTVSGRVQEKLNFCVVAVQDSGTSDAEVPTTFSGCAALTGVNDGIVDLGVIDSGAMARSPVPNNPPSTLGNGRYGLAMLNTNASNGTAVTYYAEPDTTPGSSNQLRSFRVPGAVCNALATTLTDQCFQSAVYTTDLNDTSPVEGFGMNIPCIINNAAGGAVPSGYVSNTDNMAAETEYDNEGTTLASLDCEKSETGAAYFNWNDTSTADLIAQSTGSLVVDNEILKLNFAGRTAATTPTGTYTVVSTFIATPTF